MVGLNRKITPQRVWNRIRPTPFRKSYYSSWQLRFFGFRKIGKNVRIEKSVKIVNPHNIEIGDNVIIDQFTTIVAGTAGVKIGSYIHIAGNCHLAGGGGIVLEDFSGVSHGSKLYSISDDYTGASLTNPTIPSDLVNFNSAPLLLRKHVIIGALSVILPGVELGEGTAVGAMSTVNRSTKPWGIYVGSPARRLAERKKDLLESEKQVWERVNCTKD